METTTDLLPKELWCMVLKCLTANDLLVISKVTTDFDDIVSSVIVPKRFAINASIEGEVPPLKQTNKQVEAAGSLFF